MTIARAIVIAHFEGGSDVKEKINLRAVVAVRSVTGSDRQHC